MLKAVVLAGSPNSGPLRECSSESCEAMIRIGAKPMIRYVVEALLESRSIDKIIVAGPVELKNVFPEDSIEVVEATGTVIENLTNGFNRLDHTGRVLIAACDIPLLTAKAVNEFIKMGGDKSVDLYYPIVPMHEIHQRFPEISRTCVKLREGTFTGGNLFLVNPEIIGRCAPLAQKFINYRKSPFHLCRLLGLKFVLKFLVNRLSIPEIEEKISNLLKIKGKAVITGYPEIGIDVDKPSDYSIISCYLDKPA